MQHAWFGHHLVCRWGGHGCKKPTILRTRATREPRTAVPVARPTQAATHICRTQDTGMHSTFSSAHRFMLAGSDFCNNAQHAAVISISIFIKISHFKLTPNLNTAEICRARVVPFTFSIFKSTSVKHLSLYYFCVIQLLFLPSDSFFY